MPRIFGPSQALNGSHVWCLQLWGRKQTRTHFLTCNTFITLGEKQSCSQLELTRCFSFCSWSKLSWCFIFLPPSKWSTVSVHGAGALFSSAIIDSNYSPREERGETWEVKILKLVTVIFPSFLPCSSIFLVVFRKLILHWNENSSLKALAQRRLVSRETHWRLPTAWVLLCWLLFVCFLCGRITLTPQEENRDISIQTWIKSLSLVIAWLCVFPVLGRVLACCLVLALWIISYWSCISCADLSSCLRSPGHRVECS